jgi:hypothetical protein
LTGEALSKCLDNVLDPPKVRKRVKRSSRDTVVFELDGNHRFLPLSTYPCSGGLMNIARFYKPNVSLFTRHEEWEPTEKKEHRVLVSAIIRRASCVGTLYERHRALEKVFQQVMNENSSLFGEIRLLRELLDGGSQQEDILKTALEREREMRKAIERERSAIVRAKEEVEEDNERAHQQIMQLQNMLQQAVDYHGVTTARKTENFYGYQQQQVGV